MATQVTVNNQRFTRRNPVAVWIGLPIITLGIYHFVWWYKINNEARRFLADESIRPGISVLALTLGWILIVPPFISIYRTTERVARMQERAGKQVDRANPWIALVLSFLWSLHSLYLQMQLNEIWDGYLRQGTTSFPPPMPTIPPPAPPTGPPPPPPIA